MLYVLINNNSIIYGASPWNAGMFKWNIENDLEMVCPPLPQKVGDDFILNIDENTKILPAVLEYPNYNQKIEQLAGPFWEFTDTQAIGSFNVVDKPVLIVKNELKNSLANNRYQYEIKGTTVILNEKEYNIPTDRDSRNIYVQKILSMDETSASQFKLNGDMLELSKNDFVNILKSIDTYVQSAFDKEAEIINIIESTEDLTTLDGISLEIK